MSDGGSPNIFLYEHVYISIVVSYKYLKIRQWKQMKKQLKNCTLKQTSINTIDRYIDNFQEEIQKILEDIRKTIQAAAPDAREKISYAMPTFELNGNLVHFAVKR